jgi:signal transduction histidine kinase
MLHEFLTANREEILRLTRARVAKRAAPLPTHEELTHGIPRFFDELVTILKSESRDSLLLGRDATVHGGHRQQVGFTVAQLVHDYGDLCQVITQLALDTHADIATQDFKTLNGCLDDAIAYAVTEYAQERARLTADEEIQRLGFLAHELRNHLHTASLAYQALKTGTVAIGGSTGAVLGRSLAGLQDLVDRSMAQVRLDAGIQHHQRIEIAPFLEEVEAAGTMVARAHGMSLSIERGSTGVAVEADRQLLGSAVSNLLQNAFKYSHERGHVRLRTTATRDRVVIEVEDQCGGLLKADQITEIFEGFRQGGQDRSGLGLGLAIAKRAIESMHGTVRARNNAGIGCVFTIELPRLVSSA